MGRAHASLAHSLLARGHLQGVGGDDDGDADGDDGVDGYGDDNGDADDGVDGCGDDDDKPLPQGFPDLDVPART